MLYYCIFAVYSSFIISQLNNPQLSNSYYQIINRGKGPTLQYNLVYSSYNIHGSSIGMGVSGSKWPLDPDVIWQHLTINSDESSIVWPKSTYSYYK